jgi:hypothetical protein
VFSSTAFPTGMSGLCIVARIAADYQIANEYVVC